MEKELTQKVEIKTIPLHGLFIHRNEVWRSLGKLRAESHSTSAQKVFMNEHGTEVYTANADFIDGIDWEQRRYEIAKEILPSVLETSFGARTEVEDKNLVVSYAIEWADALIDKLKTRRINDE